MLRKGDIITLRVIETDNGYLKAETVNGGDKQFDIFERLQGKGVTRATRRNLGVPWARQLAMRDAFKKKP
jgi:hypothetical protein